MRESHRCIKIFGNTNRKNRINCHLAILPAKYRLDQNYPNPFNPSTKINFSITKPGFVSLKVFDITGKEVDNLLSENLKTGTYEYSFNGAGLSSGTYFYTLRVNEFIQTKSMILIK